MSSKELVHGDLGPLVGSWVDGSSQFEFQIVLNSNILNVHTDICIKVARASYRVTSQCDGIEPNVINNLTLWHKG